MRLSLALILAVVFATILMPGCGSGPVVWERTIDSGADEAAAGLSTDGTNLIAVGTMATPAGKTSWLLQLVCVDGNPLWTRTYSEGEANVAGDVVMGPDGAIFVTGTSRLEGRDMCVVARYGTNGSLLWHRALAIGDHTEGNGICLSGDRVVVCGTTFDNDEPDILVVALDTAGTTLWSKTFDLGEVEEAFRIAAGRDGEVAVCGRIQGEENLDVVIMKLDADGDTTWTRRYDSGGIDNCGDVTFDVFGNILATGTAMGDAARCVILEYHPDGELIRRAAYTETAAAEGWAIETTGEGDIFVAGQLHGAEPRRLLAFQYLPNANITWERIYVHGNDEVSGRALAIDGDVFVLGTVERADGTSDMVLVRFLRRDPDDAG